MDFRRTYRAAAVAYADLVSRIPADRLDSPGLGDWSLRDLIGHTASSGLREVPSAIATSAAELQVPSAEAYWAFARSAPRDMVEAAMAASTRDARETGKSFGDQPGTAVQDLAGRATAALAEAGDDDVVASAIGGMRLRDWITTRTFELAVHGLDTARAADLPFEVSAEVLADAAAMAARVAATVGDGAPVLRALTGRGALPEGFSII
ncbi:maleylpyruvate isomerase N-terminal domain-containing protein [Mangrovihabitans endophyticus]|uniref:Mycothiol-dependent maleylpyruvate isomerase metal-binding domain-containing protein n=1 Tax=Mangrovihabitans endophyticus TaxID=1751298 RepID=A0A8J3FRF5_9ACTN|nr:maleylpyruvate isomerase N-terminal domain-containing protein [Mangrovihabitans endophyticus]GGL09008.1 hypothetical protein GCM10012284_49580 [Mangrovihabitans endophyticus]